MAEMELAGVNLPYSLDAEQSVLGAIPVSYTHLDVYKRQVQLSVKTVFSVSPPKNSAHFSLA